MAVRTLWRRMALACGMVLAGWLVSGCGAGMAGLSGGRAEADWQTLTMIPVADQWPSALPRFLDIADVAFDHALAQGTIQFRYDPTPDARYLVGEIKGTGLKPNFCYQLKLAGKPGTSSGGIFPGEADMDTNAAILRGGRWWDYLTEAAQFNTTDPNVPLASADYAAGYVAGYVYFGYVLTDEHGNIKGYGGKTALVPADADGWVPISANRCYHITGRTGQEGKIGLAGDTTPVTYSLTRGTDYGYAVTTSTPSFQLWYEKEGDNSLDFVMPAGSHDVVLMVTEESFHNNMGAGWTSGTDGGFWKTVFVSDWTTNPSPKTGGTWTPTRGSRIRFTTPNLAPTAAFTATPSALSVSCASTSTDADGTIVDYAWTFGDGGTASGVNATHTYTAAGTYTITLTVTDNLGGVGTASKQVTVVAAPNNVMTATVYTTWLGSAGKYQPHAQIQVMANGAPVAGASVTGVFSGSFTSKSAANATDATGKALFYGPPNSKKIGALTFTVTKITKTGYTAAGLPVSDSY